MNVLYHSTQNCIPTECPYCKSSLVRSGVHLKCFNNKCIEQETQKVVYWVKQCEMEEVSEMTIRSLFEWCFITDVNSLYALTNDPISAKELLKSIPGFGEKTIQNIINQVNKSKSMTIIQFISRLGIPLVHEKAVKNLEIKSFQEFLDFKDTTYVIGQNLIAFREENKDFINELYSVLKVSDVSFDTDKVKVCMTGSDPWKKGRKALIEEINNKGYEFVDSVTKDTKMLICEDVNGTSGKLQKARKDGITLISYEEFF